LPALVKRAKCAMTLCDGRVFASDVKALKAYFAALDANNYD
jgi:hypothetical protein